MILVEDNSFEKTYEAIDNLNETLYKQQLKTDWHYSNVDEILRGKDPVNIYTKITPEGLLQAFSKAGFIDKYDNIILPKGTILNWKKTIAKDLYDLYYVQGKPTCYIAVGVHDQFDLFGDDTYKEIK